MTTENDHTIDAPSSPDEAALKSKKLTLIGIVITLVSAIIGAILIAVITAPYSGSAVIKSHVPFSAYVCALTVQQDNGKTVTYQKTMEAPYCEGVVDGSKVEIKDGKIV